MLEDSDDERLCKYGTALDPYHEDEIPSKKPIHVEDQIVLDSNGKRRFHGAFTGGFAAGFWNTVGSAEGFKPQQFKSSRFEKAQNVKQNAADFMDDEDKGEFGFAPEQIKTKPDFGPSAEGPSKANKRKLYKSFDSGPIPGVPVLESLMKPANDKAAVRILKHMGWKEGQGVGARMTRIEKKRAKVQNQKEMYVLKKYGCDMGPMSATTSQQPEEDSDSGSDLSEYEITFAPDDFDPFIVTLKQNTFGIGYSGLDRNPVLSKAQHVNLFAPFEIHDKNNKKLSIRGQAFGVGALEEEDEDIYARDDMTRYDFSLEDGKKKAKPKTIKAKVDTNIVEGFCVPERGNKKQGKKVFYINMPENFQPRNWAVRKSRFEPLDGRRAKALEDGSRYKRLGLGRHDLTPEERGKLINETPETAASTSKEPPSNPIIDLILQKANQFVAGEVLNQEDKEVVTPMTQTLEKEKEKLKAEANKITNSVAPKVPTETFKPFVYNEDKQIRYEKFLTFDGTSVEAIDTFLTANQPLSMTDWERKFERQEFTQAKKMYKPLDGLMFDRFVSETKIDYEKHKEEQAKAAAALANKKIEIKRTKVMWKPHKDLCKRFNVPEPFGGMMIDEKPKKRTRFSVFDYLEVPVNTRKDFVTPVIIPKQSNITDRQLTQKKHDLSSSPYTHPPPPIIKPAASKVPISTTPRLTAKEFFNEDSLRPVVVPFVSRTERQSPPVEEQTIPPPTVFLTELETKVVESKNKKPEEKQDLFKSIFCDSSDEDEEEAATTASQQKTDADKIKLIESIVAIKPASEFNVLRNQSPPRGIFKNLFTRKPKIPEAGPSNATTKIADPVIPETNPTDLYGPKIPDKIIHIHSDSSDSSDSEDDSDIDEKLLKHLKRQKKNEVVVEEAWVEKDKLSPKSEKKKKKKSKKSKKHKKDKKKHKKRKKD